MNDPKTEAQAAQFCEEMFQINHIYEVYARNANYTYASLQILTRIRNTENCTQKFLSERAFLPKQTVNNIITSFVKQGLVELRESEGDRRSKVIYLTEKGEAVAKETVPLIRKAEYEAIARLGEQEREALLEGLKKYRLVLEEIMLSH